MVPTSNLYYSKIGKSKKWPHLTLGSDTFEIFESVLPSSKLNNFDISLQNF